MLQQRREKERLEKLNLKKKQNEVENYGRDKAEFNEKLRLRTAKYIKVCKIYYSTQ